MINCPQKDLLYADEPSAELAVSELEAAVNLVATAKCPLISEAEFKAQICPM